ncbi:MAG TPA: TetR/AcrR family transcriptional regulator [Solirubrobacteraceae bacterium]
MRVSEVQRARIIAAMARVVADDGVGAATVARVVARAGVSRRTFYDMFSGCEDCFLAMFESTVEHASAIVNEASIKVRPVWREQVRAGLTALLLFFDEEPDKGRLLVVEALAAGPRVLRSRARVLTRLTAIIDRGRSQAPNRRRTPSVSPPLTAEGTVGAVLAVIHARMVEPERRPLIELLNPLMGMIVLPYLGQAAATRECEHATIPPPVTRHAPHAKEHAGENNDNDAAAVKSSRGAESPQDPFEGLNMRLTYRTLMVLTAIADTPAASNRQVGESAGVHDQGQISKLLHRLQRLGLIHNTGHGQPTGEPNAWTLTPRGHDIHHTLHT